MIDRMAARSPDFVPTVAVRVYRPLAAALAARGIAFEPILRELGIPDPAGAGWNVRVPVPAIIGMWNRLIEVTGDPSFGLLAAEHFDLTSCDVITYLESSAASVRQALQKKLAYLPLITDAMVWSLEVDGTEAALALRWRPPGPPFAPAAEYLLASRQVFFAGFGPAGWRLRFVHFRHPAPIDIAAYVRTFGVPPRFDAAEDQLGFAAALLDRPMRNRDDALAELLERYAGHLAGAQPDGARLASDRVRDALRGGFDPGIRLVAERLGTSVRTLQRNLASEGTTYFEVADAMRRAAAERLLARRELSASEIAHALGFRDLPAFHRAFRRWTGDAPGQFRARVLGPHAPTPPAGTERLQLPRRRPASVA
jgi:AraC-like DNA-binding protein